MRFIDKSVYLEEEKILVISDLHLGYEQGLQEQGVFIPRQQYKQIIEDLNRIFLEIFVNEKSGDDNGSVNSPKLKEIIILGDLKHEFSHTSSQEWREVLDLLEYLLGKAEKITIIRGNHDNFLSNVVKNKENIKLVDYYILEENAFMHGDKIFSEVLDKKIKKIFLGHMHPAISIAKGVKEEKYKCFLTGKYKDKEIIILPSFFPLVEGSEVSIEDTNLALKLNLSSFEVYIPAGIEVLDFGKLKNAGRLV